MKTIFVRFLLVLLILSQAARAYGPESTLLLGTIQFPTMFKNVESVPVIFRGNPLTTQVDQSNKTVTFTLFREPTQFNFGLLVAEPQHIEPVSLTSKYHTEPSTLIAYQRVKKNCPYRYFTLMLIPDITFDEKKTKKVTYSWRWRETTLDDELRIPDDALIVQAVPTWVDTLHTGAGFNFPTICMRHDLGSDQDIQKQLEHIALARLDKKPFEGQQQKLVTKLVGNTVVIAPPQRHA